MLRRLLCVLVSLSSSSSELFSSIGDYFSYMKMPVTFSVKIEEFPEGQVRFPKRYDQGYNELDSIGQNFLSIKKCSGSAETGLLGVLS